MLSLLDPLPDEGQQLVDLVAYAYRWTGAWPGWQFIVQQMWEKHDVDAEAALRELPRWPWGYGPGYRAIRTVPAAAGDGSPDLEARGVLTLYGLIHTGDHPLSHAFLKAIEIAVERQRNVTLSPLKPTPITVSGTDLVGVVNHCASTNLRVAELGLLLSGEPPTAGGGVSEKDEWDWDLTRYPQLPKFVSPDATSYLTKLENALGVTTPHLFARVAPEALPRALDHLNVAWKALTRQHRLFYPRGLAGTANLVEPVAAGDQLTARLGALADVFDLFMRGPDDKPKHKTLTLFRDELMKHIPETGQQRADQAIGMLLDINELRNGRLHTDSTKWAECLTRVGIVPSEPPDKQWDRVRSAAVEALYTIIELLQPLIS
jgi:hypothetical protein